MNFFAKRFYPFASLIFLVLFFTAGHLNHSLAATETDLSLRIQNATADSAKGQIVSYELRAFNNSQSESAFSVQSVAALPAGASYIAGSDEFCHQDGANIVCDFFTIQPQKAKFRTLKFQVVKCGADLNLSVVLNPSNQNTDGNLSNNTANFRTTIAACPQLDLTLRTQNYPTTAALRDGLSYELRAFNNDLQNNIFNVQSETIIPDGFTYLPDPDNFCHQTNDKIICDFFTLEPQKAKFRQLRFSAQRCPLNATIASRVFSKDEIVDPTPQNNISSVTTAISCVESQAVDLSIRTQNSPLTAGLGYNVGYQLRAFNNNPNLPAFFVTSKTDIPNGYSFIADQDGFCRQEGSRVVCDYFTLDPQKAKFRTLWFSVDQCVASATLLSEILSGQSSDPDLTNNFTSFQTAINCPVVPVSPPAGYQIVKVISLATEGPGTLDAALKTAGKKIIVFEVGGIIDLRGPVTANRPLRDLEINTSDTIIAGETAPFPGINIIGGGIRVQASNVYIRHIRIRVGNDSGTNLSIADGIQIIGTKSRPVNNVLVENVSLAWATDENASTYIDPNQGYEPGLVKNVTFNKVIFAEGLHLAGRTLNDEPRGHSNGFLVGVGSQEIVIGKSLFAHNQKRHPEIGGDSSTFFFNNLIYNPANQIMKMSGAGSIGGQMTAIGNVALPGPSTQQFALEHLMWVAAESMPQTKVYLNDNQLVGRGFDWNVSGSDYLHGEYLFMTPLIWRPSANFDILPSSQVTDFVLANAGARPWESDPVDNRVKQTVKDRSGRRIDSHQDVGGFPVLPNTHRVFNSHQLAGIPNGFLTGNNQALVAPSPVITGVPPVFIPIPSATPPSSITKTDDQIIEELQKIVLELLNKIIALLSLRLR